MTRSPNMAEVIRQAIEDRLAELHVCLPGKIQSYDPATQKANVQPLIKRLQKTVDGELNEELPVLPAVPVAWPRAGGMKLTLPVNAGDYCLLVFCERSIDSYQVGQGIVTDPEAFQMHDLSDAIAYMGWYPDSEKLTSTDQDYINLGADAGSFDFVALAQKVLDELNDVKTDLDGFKTAYDNHIHTTTATVSAGSPGVIAPTVSSAPVPHTPASVAAQDVKVS